MDNAEKPSLLFVDDSKVMRLAAGKMLGADFNVVVAENGVEAWERVRTNAELSVVFSDLVMPEMDGFELLKKIRTCEDAGIAGLPVIIVTGADNDDNARAEALRLGATDFISKPFNSTDLLARARVHANYQKERANLVKQAMVDPLTRLGNRRYLLHRLRQELALAVRQQYPFAVVQIEVHQFNKLFVQLGKRRTDMLLMKLAGMLKGVIRKEDSLARSSVAQFTVLLPSARAEGAKRFAERALKASDALSFQFKGVVHKVPLLFAIHAPQGDDLGSLVQVQASLSEAMKSARKLGNGAIVGAGTADAETAERSSMTVEQALSLLEAGKTKPVIDALPEIKTRLLPLLKLMKRVAANGEKK